MLASAIEEAAWESFEVHAGMSGGSPARLSSRGSNGVDGAAPHGSGALVAGA